MAVPAFQIRPTQDHRRHYLVPPAVAGLVALAAVLCLVELAVRYGLVTETVVAKPSSAIAGLVTIENRVDLVSGFGETLGITVVALALELMVAVPVGMFLFLRRDFALAYSSWLTALVSAPIFLLYPLFLVVFGRSYLTLVIMGFIPGVIPLIIQVEEGFRSVPKILIRVGQSVGASRLQIFRRIMIPAAAPSIFTGFRLSLIYTLVNIISIEYLVDIGGLGRIVADRYARFDITGTYTAIIAVTLVSVLLNTLIARLEMLVRKA